MSAKLGDVFLCTHEKSIWLHGLKRQEGSKQRMQGIDWKCKKGWGDIEMKYNSEKKLKQSFKPVAKKLTQKWELKKKILSKKEKPPLRPHNKSIEELLDS